MATTGLWMSFFYLLPAGMVLIGEPVGTTRALLLAAGWVINLVVAEWIIRRPGSTPSRRGKTPGGLLVRARS